MNNKIYLILLIIIMTSLISCDKATKPRFGSISGKILLCDTPAETKVSKNCFSEMEIGLFELPVADTTHMRIKSEYPNIGTNFDEDWLFDHREHKPAIVCSPDHEGSFQFNKVSPGEYFVVALNLGYSIYYSKIRVLENENKDIGVIELEPMVIVDPVIHTEFEFSEGVQYLLMGDTIFLEQVHFAAGAAIYLSPGSNAKFYNDVSFCSDIDGTGWKISSSHKLWELGEELTSIDQYAGSCIFYNGQYSIQNGAISYLNNPLSVNSGSVEIFNMFFKSFVDGISLLDSATVIDSCTLINGISAGINAMGHDFPFELRKSIIYNMMDGVNVFLLGEYSIMDNYFVNNGYAIRLDRYAGKVSYNCFEGNYYDVHQYQVRDPVIITYNNFFHSKMFSLFPRRNAVINNNNFFLTEGYFVWIRDVGAPPTYSNVNDDIDATLNYWMPNDVEQYLNDANHNHEYPGEDCPHYVIYMPRRSTKVRDAGIRK